jgi:metal transporter CNNM
MAPAPRARVPRGKVIADPTTRKLSEQPLIDIDDDAQPNGKSPRKLSLPESSMGAPRTSFLMRRRSSGNKGTAEPLRTDDPDVLQHLRHLGPSNAALRPKSTRINTVKIKPGNATGVPVIPQTIPENTRPASSPSGVVTLESHAPEGGIGEGLLASAGREASDGVHSVAVGYGTMAPSGDRMSWRSERSAPKDAEDEPRSPKSSTHGNDYVVDHSRPVEYSMNHEEDPNYDENLKHNGHEKPRSRSVSTIASLHSVRSKSPPPRRHTARSGSISENVVDVNGIKKIVLETTSSSDSDDKVLLVTHPDDTEGSKYHSEAESANADSKGGGKKKRKKRGKKKKGNAGDNSESRPLLGDK